ncbi:MAG: peptidyl-prolyl cis-trans isomerase [Bdellovibrionales bacterium]|nr:peptidyl-prolyl cis-trans isomerase [Bdellovibrionales bacterium]
MILLATACTASKVKKQIILEVNQNELSVQEFAQRLTEKLQGSDIIIAKSTETVKNMKDVIVSDFINYTLLKEWATANNLSVTPEEIEKEIQVFRSQYPDDISFRASLAEDNITMERWKQNLEKTILERKVNQDVTKNVVEPTDKEISDYYQQNKSRFSQNKAYRIRQIVLAKSMDAEKLYAQIKKDTDFAALAKEYSISPESKEGGELGWVEEGVADVFDEAAKQPLKTITKPLKSPFGYHIVQILERRPTRQKTLQEARELIKQELFEDKKQRAYIVWLEERRSQATVKINNELLETMTVELSDE